MIKTYQMRRPSRIGLTTRERDELVPEAHLWRLTEGMVRGGRLREIEVTEADFAAAVTKYCPDQSDAICAKLGLESIQVPAKDHHSKVRGKRTVTTAPPTPIGDDLLPAG